MAGLRLPIESHVLQAFVSEGLKPVLDHVVTFGAGHFYVSQSDKGGLVFGGDLDGYNSYAQRGNLPGVEDVCESAMALMPMLGRARLLRSWGGVMDMSMDGSPIIDKTPIGGLYLNAGWCYGGIQGDSRFGLVLCASDRARPSACECRRLSSRPLLPAGTRSTKKGRAPNPICIEERSACAFPVLAVVNAIAASFRISAMPPCAGRTRRAPIRTKHSSTTFICAITAPASSRNSGITRRDATRGSWSRGIRSRTRSRPRGVRPIGSASARSDNS